MNLHPRTASPASRRRIRPRAAGVALATALALLAIPFVRSHATAAPQAPSPPAPVAAATTPAVTVT